MRAIERLAYLYFRGTGSTRHAIEGGKLTWVLEQMKRVPEDQVGCNDFERSLLKDLEFLQKHMGPVVTKCHDPRLKSRAFHAQANLLTGSLLTRLRSSGKRAVSRSCPHLVLGFPRSQLVYCLSEEVRSRTGDLRPISCTPYQAYPIRCTRPASVFPGGTSTLRRVILGVRRPQRAMHVGTQGRRDRG